MKFFLINSGNLPLSLLLLLTLYGPPLIIVGIAGTSLLTFFAGVGMSKKLFFVVFSFCFVAGALSPCFAVQKEWLGMYASAEIPGYEIAESFYTSRSAMKAPAAEVVTSGLKETKNGIIDACIEKGGVALVSVDTNMVLGEITAFTNNSAGEEVVNNYGPGGILMIEGDCVTKVK